MAYLLVQLVPFHPLQHVYSMLAQKLQPGAQGQLWYVSCKIRTAQHMLVNLLNILGNRRETRLDQT